MDLLESSRDLEFLISYHVLGIRRKIFPRECFPELRKASPAGKKRKEKRLRRNMTRDKKGGRQESKRSDQS